jgi:hypothetical protein
MDTLFRIFRLLQEYSSARLITFDYSENLVLLKYTFRSVSLKIATYVTYFSL